MKRKSIILFLTAAVLTGCSGNGSYNKSISHLKSHMKDPSSLKVSYATGYEYDGYKTFKISYTGKNSFGAYTDYSTMYVCIRPNGSIQCNHCEVLSGDSAFYYSLCASQGEQIY